MEDDERSRFSEIEFQQFLVELISRMQLGLVWHEPGIDPRLRADIVVEGRRQLTLIEVRRTVPQTERRLEDLISQLTAYVTAARKQRQEWEVTAILAIPGALSRDNIRRLSANGIQVWDRNHILELATSAGMTEQAYELLGYRTEEPRRRSIADDLQDQLRNIPCGRPQWASYQKLVGNVLEHLFCPPLRPPISESASNSRVNRRDIILPNYVSDGFWQFMRSHYRADYIVVDAKNHCAAVGKNHVLQLANYLAPHGTGMFGIIATRSGIDGAATYTCREQWMLHQKMIITVTDNDLIQMLESKKIGEEPEALLRQKIEDFRLGM